MNDLLVNQAFQNGYNERMRQLMTKQAFVGVMNSARKAIPGVAKAIPRFGGVMSGAAPGAASAAEGVAAAAPGMLRTGWNGIKNWASTSPFANKAMDFGRSHQALMGGLGGAAIGTGVTQGINSYADARRRDALSNMGVGNRLGLAFQLLTNPNAAINTMHL